MFKNIVLIGYRGTGKTEVGKKLSELLSMRYLSIDDEIVKKVKKSINEYVKSYGWKFFRDVESDIIKGLDVSETIIDCGGGVVEDINNIKNLKKDNIVILLKARPETIIERIKYSDRPSLTERSTIDEVKDMLKKRYPLYSKAADIFIDTDDKEIDTVAKEILKNLNLTKLCIPITAKNTINALTQIKKAERSADMTELRIDYLDDIDEKNLELLIKNKTKPVIVTCRKENFKGKETERISLLKKSIKLKADYIDVEHDTDEDIIKDLIINKEDTKIIISYHDFEKTPELKELEKLYDNLKDLNPDLIKIVTKANSFLDNKTIFGLLKKRFNLISFCMGIHGKFSRVLAKKYGSRITFASLDEKSRSEESQLTVKELNSEYNYKTSDRNTKLLGVIGEHAENSKSRFMHNKMFKKFKLNCIYHPLKLRSEELAEFMAWFRTDNFIGAAVTVPHKIAIMKHLDKVDETAREISAVNTIVKDDDELIGYNTDHYGAVEALKEKIVLKDAKILIMGAGGAARAIVYGLSKEEADITIINRSFEKAKDLAKKFGCKYKKMGELKEIIEDREIIINTTSVGMSPNTKESVVPKECLKEGKVVMDIIYTPIKTKLIKDAEKVNCSIITGERMLIYQAMQQYRLWTGNHANFKIMEKAILKKIKRR